MTVNVSKPALNVREKLAELDKPTGIAGEAMLRAETPQEQFNLIGAGRRNLIINGDMRIAQRGTGANIGIGNTQGYKTVDRWRFNSVGVDQFVATASQDTDAPSGFSSSAKLLTTTAESGIGGANERVSIEQRIEAQDLQMLNYGTSDAQGMTLSFWVKSNVTGKFSINVRAHDAGDAYVAPYYINSADTWEYKTVYIKGNTLSGGGITNDNGIGMWIRFMLIVSADQRSDSFTNKWVASSTASYGPTDMQSEWGLTVNDYFQITGVQLELGKVATPFEHRSYGEELALCQRYYYKINSADNNAPYQRYAVVSVETSTNAEAFFQHPVTMRTNPTLEASAAANFHIYSANTATVLSTNMVIDQSSPSTTGLALTVASGLTAGRAGLLNSNNNNTSYIAFNAEL